MYKTTATRRELLDFIQGSPSTQMELLDDREPAKLTPDDRGYTVLWDRTQPQGELPTVILIPISEQDDFLGWAYTYLPAMRPFTAFVRVLDPRTFEQLSVLKDRRSLGALREACAALIIGEALSYLEPKSELRLLTPVACSNTYSFALARAFILGLEGQDEEISQAWYGVRELTKQNVNAAVQQQVRNPWEILSRLATGALEQPYRHTSLAPIEKACRELLDLGDIRPDTWSGLTSVFSGMDDVRDKMALTRESRITAFESILPGLSRSYEEDSTVVAFIAGYIGSRITPGELEHITLYLRPFPFASEALCWFSLCAGLQAHGQMFSFAEGLGRRILRDLDQPEAILSRPRSDLAYSELRVLFDREKKLSEFRTSSSNALSIELAPGVTTSVRWPRPSEAQNDLFEKRESSPEARALLAELSFSLDRANDVRRRLERTLGGGPSSHHYVPEKRPRK